MFRVSPPWSARQQCHLSYLAEFTSSIVHVPGPENVVAGALSRPSSVLSPSASTLVSPSRVSLVKDPGVTPLKEFLPGSAPSLLSPALSPSSSDAPVISGFDISTSVAAHLPLRLRDVFFTYSLRGFSSSQSWYIAL